MVCVDNYDLHSEFDIEKHKAKYINYLEVLIEEDGHVLYAVPSHQELAIKLACKAKHWSRDQLNKKCPPEYYFDFLPWVLSISNAVSVWNTMYIGNANEAQINTLKSLKKAGLYTGNI